MMIFRFESTILYIIFPNALVQLVLVGFNYFQHRDCDPYSKYNHSRNFTGDLLNFLTFNNGYHTAHHLFPAAHWTEYREMHNKIKHHIDQDLIDTNLLVYFFNLLFTRKSNVVVYRDKEAMIQSLKSQI